MSSSQKNYNVNFMKFHKFFLVLSTLMMVATIILLFTKGLNLGIDFTGGMLLEIKTAQAADIADMRSKLDKLSLGKPLIQEFGDGSIMIKLPGKEMTQVQQKSLNEEIKQLLNDKNIEFRRVEYVGPQVGKELILVGIKAFAYSLIGIMAYIWFRFEWQFGVSGVFSLAHDVCASLLFMIFTGFEFDLTSIAAVLLVAGYSINDTVVVFDRVRELLKKYRKMDLQELLNLSVNQTLSRTIKTGLTTVMALISLLIFGAEVIKPFTYIILVGLVIGTYSSVFIASPMLIYMNLKRE